MVSPAKAAAVSFALLCSSSAGQGVITQVKADNQLYCPGANDWFGNQDYTPADGPPGFQKWGVSSSGLPSVTTKNRARIGTKSTYNLLEGWVLFDMDTSEVDMGVNTNLYTVSPPATTSVQHDYYCDGQGMDGWMDDEGGKNPFCMELDFVENNGSCYAQAAIHTVDADDPGNTDHCGHFGCKAAGPISGNTRWHAAVSHDGVTSVQKMNLTEKDQALSSADDIKNMLELGAGMRQQGGDAVPATSDAIVVKTMTDQGAQLKSSMWTGWVPTEGACTDGNNPDVPNSIYALSNVIICGQVVKEAEGHSATLCSPEIYTKYQEICNNAVRPAGPTPTPTPPTLETWTTSPCSQKGNATECNATRNTSNLSSKAFLKASDGTLSCYWDDKNGECQPTTAMTADKCGTITEKETCDFFNDECEYINEGDKYCAKKLNH